MAISQISLLVVALVASALALPQQALQTPANNNDEDLSRPYAYNYDIQDGIAGSSHSRSETQKDGVTRGFYRYTRPDGVLVSVSYTADENGYHPVITEEAAPVITRGSAFQTMEIPGHDETLRVKYNAAPLAAPLPALVPVADPIPPPVPAPVPAPLPVPARAPEVVRYTPVYETKVETIKYITYSDGNRQEIKYTTYPNPVAETRLQYSEYSQPQPEFRQQHLANYERRLQ